MTSMRMPLKPKRKNVGAKQHHRPHLRLREWATDATRVAAHQVDLELLEFVGRNLNVGQFSEAGADAIDDLPARDDLLHDATRSLNRGVRLRRNLHRLGRERDTGDFRE